MCVVRFNHTMYCVLIIQYDDRGTLLLIENVILEFHYKLIPSEINNSFWFIGSSIAKSFFVCEQNK